MNVPDLALVALGGLISALGFLVKRYISRQDTHTEKASDEDRALRQLIDSVEHETLERHAKLSNEMNRLRQYVDATFVRHREIEGIKQDIAVRFAEMREDMHKHFDRMIAILERKVK